MKKLQEKESGSSKLLKELESEFKHVWIENEKQLVSSGFYDNTNEELVKAVKTLSYDCGFRRFIENHYEEQNAINQEQEQKGNRKEH